MSSALKNISHKLWPLRWRPLLDLWCDIGLLQFQTAVWRESYNTDAVEYMILEGRLLRKWGFRFRLYDTGMRRMENGR